MALDPVNAKAVKGKFKDREDKDLDNDGDSDASDEYLHKRRSAVSKAIKSVKESKMTPDQMRKALDDDKANAKSKDKVSLKKAPWDMKESVELDEANLSQQQRDRLDDLIFNVMITGNIEYDGKDNPTRHLKTIEKEFGPKVAKQVEAGMDIKNWGRDNRSSGIDSLALRKKSRISASGKMNKQDAVALGKRIMQDKSFGGLTKKVKLPEDTQIDEKYDTPVKKKPVSMMTKDEKDKNDERRKSYKEYQKSLRKEDTQIDEISMGKMAAYADKAVKSRNDAKAATYSADSNRRDKAQKTIVKRKAGADNYNKKMWGYSNVAPTKESVSRVLGRMVEAKDNYTIAHKTFSSAVQHAEEVTKKRGFEIDPDVWDRKVAMGPRKPGVGKTNSYNIDLMKNGKDVKQKLHMQVYYDEGRYELNMYIS